MPWGLLLLPPRQRWRRSRNRDFGGHFGGGREGRGGKVGEGVGEGEGEGFVELR